MFSFAFENIRVYALFSVCTTKCLIILADVSDEEDI